MAKKHKKHLVAHKPSPWKIYQRSDAFVHLGMEDFRLVLLRPSIRGGHTLIDGITETIDWRGDPGDPVLHGGLVLRRPFDVSNRIAMHDGDPVRLDVRWNGAWRDVWQMRLYEPADNRTLADGGMSWDLHDDGYFLQLSRIDWSFVASKHDHPDGWYCHEIIAAVCRKLRIPVGKIAEGKHRIKHLVMKNSTPMQVVQRAYKLEREHSKRRYSIRWDHGKLNILPLRRNPALYVLGPQIIDATLGRKARDDEEYATAVVVTATSKDKKKIQKLVVADGIAKTESLVIKKVHPSGDINSNDDAESYGKRYLVKHAKRDQTAQVEHVGMPFIRRGDGHLLRIPSEGLDGGKQSFVFVASHSHSLSSSGFTMTLDFTFSDPYATPKERQTKKDKAAAERKSAQRARWRPGGVREPALSS